jgi:Tol biopolymer transport system component
VVFGWWKSGQPNLYWQLADGSQPMERLTTSENWQSPVSFCPDGTTLLFEESRPDIRSEINLLDLRPRRVTPFLKSKAYQESPQVSPDGRWIAYRSDESGRGEVYVRTFPGPGGKWQVSSEGGVEPIWARNGRRLFYRSTDRQQVWVVDVQTEGGFSPGKPRLLFKAPGLGAFGLDISLDGRHFLMEKDQERKPQPVTELILVQNWFEELKRLAPTGKK